MEFQHNFELTVLPVETSGIEFKVNPGLQLPLGAWQNNPHIHLKPQNITANTYLVFSHSLR